MLRHLKADDLLLVNMTRIQKARFYHLHSTEYNITAIEVLKDLDSRLFMTQPNSYLDCHK